MSSPVSGQSWKTLLGLHVFLSHSHWSLGKLLDSLAFLYSSLDLCFVTTTISY